MSAVRRSGSAENCQTPAVERAPGLPNLSSIDPQLNGYENASLTGLIGSIASLPYLSATCNATSS